MSDFYVLPRIVAGNNVTIVYRVDNQQIVPPIPMTPDGGVVLSIRQPDQVIAVDSAIMTAVSPGYYRHDFQSAEGQMAGVWMGRAVSTHEGKQNASPWQALFSLVPA
jgi:hypothetical protein